MPMPDDNLAGETRQAGEREARGTLRDSPAGEARQTGAHELQDDLRDSPAVEIRLEEEPVLRNALGYEYLDAMSGMEIENAGKSDLVNIQDVEIDSSLPAAEKMRRYLEQIKNPYCFLCGDVPVKLRFSDDGVELEEILKKHFIALKRR